MFVMECPCAGQERLSRKAASYNPTSLPRCTKSLQFNSLGTFTTKEISIMRRFIVLAAACSLSGSLLAQTAAPAAPAAPAAAPEKEKKSCRREEVTGSIMQPRICHTKEEWMAIDEANRQNADSFAASRRSARASSPGG
jgi:hypothetical protein